jgi:hypothetical protein
MDTKDEYIHQQKAIWQRHFRQDTGGSNPPLMESFLAEQSQLLDAFHSDPERASLRDTFLTEQRRVFNLFQAFRPTDPGQDLGELPDCPSSREEFLAQQNDLYFNLFQAFRPTDPGQDLDKLPDRPSSREEFLALQEDLYRQYPGERPRLLISADDPL